MYMRIMTFSNILKEKIAPYTYEAKFIIQLLFFRNWRKTVRFIQCDSTFISNINNVYSVLYSLIKKVNKMKKIHQTAKRTR